MPQAEIGIIGGSGLYSMPGFTDVREVQQETPFGAPSDAYILGTLEGRSVAFLARHARGHKLLPTELNFRANIYGFKQLGVERIVSVSARPSGRSRKSTSRSISSSPTSSSIVRATAWILSSATASSPTLASAIRYAERWRAWLRAPARRSL